MSVLLRRRPGRGLPRVRHPALGARRRARLRRFQPVPGPGRGDGPRAAGRTARLSPLLDGRAPQHARRRQPPPPRPSPMSARENSTIRIGAGEVMLPNHAPLIIAEQFGTLAALFPGRVDLGLGRAPGTDGLTCCALRRPGSSDDLLELLNELYGFFNGFAPGDAYDGIHAVPGYGSMPAVWLLGSSGYSAQVAGLMGLPFAFAHHFSAANTLPALDSTGPASRSHSYSRRPTPRSRCSSSAPTPTPRPSGGPRRWRWCSPSGAAAGRRQHCRRWPPWRPTTGPTRSARSPRGTCDRR